MARSFRFSTALILPLVLLTVSLGEDLVTFYARRYVHDIYLRTALVVGLQGAAFAFAAVYLVPWLKRLYVRVRRDSRRVVGELGLWLFYAAAYGGVYYAYLLVEQHGPGALIP